MCGIAGILGKKAGLYCQVSKMVQSIGHRGPDSSGIWEEEPIVLGHARLAIVDLSDSGSQPMLSRCERFALVFNGEIYNHVELRNLIQKEVPELGWRGHSDTETLLACFSIWGIERTLRETVGMFAIALWDRTERRLVLARDRFGEKPLYWAMIGDQFTFSSELKALKTLDDFQPKICVEALASYLRHNYISAPATIYENVHKLEPGQYLSVSIDSSITMCQPVRYWDINSAIEQGVENRFVGSEAEAMDELESVLSRSIAGQMLADVPLGAFLSGGVDSSMVTALMQKNSGKPVKTFAIGFEDPKFNEAGYAADVAKHLGTDHHEFIVTSQDALDVVPKLSSIYCEPFADSSQIPTFLVSHMAKQQVTVALTGDSGDELFGGYNTYQMTPKYWNMIKHIPLSLRKIISRSAAYLPPKDNLMRLLSIFDARDQYDFFRKLSSHHVNPALLIKSDSEILTPQSDRASWPDVGGLQEWMMAVDTKQYMTDDILVKVDRASMANSLETRVPFLDHRVFEFAWRLPIGMKIRNGQGKYLLRELLYKYIPKNLIERPKKGFSVPVGQWLKGDLREWTESLLHEEKLISHGFFDAVAVRALVDEHMAGKRNHSQKLWGLLMFQAWLEENA